MSQKIFTDRPVAYHLVARAQAHEEPFLNRAICQMVWGRLRRSFPDCVAAVLMPNHLHLVIWGSAVKDQWLLKQKFGTIFKGLNFGESPQPETIPDLNHLRRTVRYVHLNPCRAKLIADPLRWEWSTHQEYVGLSLVPWLKVQANLRRLGFKDVESFHRYVTSDPSVHVAGTALPVRQNLPIILSMKAVEAAAEMAFRAPCGAFRKKGRLRARLTTVLAGPFGIPLRHVAREFGLHPSSVSNKGTRRREPTGVAEAAAVLTMILTDTRLQKISTDISRNAKYVGLCPTRRGV